MRHSVTADIYRVPNILIPHAPAPHQRADRIADFAAKSLIFVCICHFGSLMLQRHHVKTDKLSLNMIKSAYTFDNNIHLNINFEKGKPSAATPKLKQLPEII